MWQWPLENFTAACLHSTKKPVTTMLTYPWKCTVLHCNHLGNTWKPLVLMTRHFDYCPSASKGDNQSVGSSAPVVSRCFPGGYNVKLYISRDRLAWWLLTFLHSALNNSILITICLYMCTCRPSKTVSLGELARWTTANHLLMFIFVITCPWRGCKHHCDLYDWQRMIFRDKWGKTVTWLWDMIFKCKDSCCWVVTKTPATS